ncbi:MAG: hypothetical protein OER96_10570 [Gammaproteobacteria bacterium]|nr:hypothetical protein [Gammaproteobacteria bacterium]
MITFITTRAGYILACGVFLGLFLPSLAHVLRPGLTFYVAVLLYLALLNIDWSQMRGYFTSPMLASFAVIWILAVSPVLAWWVTRYLQFDPGVAAAIVFMASAPPIMSAPSMIALVRLDAALAMICLLLTTLIAPFTITLVAAGLINTSLSLSPLSLLFRLLFFISVCIVAAVLTRRTVGVERLQVFSHFNKTISVILLLIFAIAIMDGVTARLFENPAHVLKVTGIAFAANGVLFIAGAALFRPTGWRRCLTVAFAGANCNMGLILAVLPATSNPDIFLYFAVAQIPMYLTPLALELLSARLRLHGV